MQVRTEHLTAAGLMVLAALVWITPIFPHHPARGARIEKAAGHSSAVYAWAELRCRQWRRMREENASVPVNADDLIGVSARLDAIADVRGLEAVCLGTRQRTMTVADVEKRTGVRPGGSDTDQPAPPRNPVART